LEVFPIKIAKKTRKFDLFKTIVKSGFQFYRGDIIVISSKFVAISEGSIVKLNHVIPSRRSRLLAKRLKMDERIVEMVLRESDTIVNGIPGFLLTIKDGMIAPNAGIDKSNAPKGAIILYPRDPFKSAQQIRSKFSRVVGIKVGVVISDSRLMPTRIGTTGVAIGVSGLEPVEDLRGKRDLFGNKLQVTIKATADDLATIGVFIMGESNEGIPVVVIRGASIKITGRKLSFKDMTVDSKIDIYLRDIRTNEFLSQY
jgi:coenzyme F420-0:L-glutamate ligase/coenzyme F420-1:gamma-L-glutamate ligase